MAISDCKSNEEQLVLVAQPYPAVLLFAPAIHPIRYRPKIRVSKYAFYFFDGVFSFRVVLNDVFDIPPYPIEIQASFSFPFGCFNPNRVSR